MKKTNQKTYNCFSPQQLKFLIVEKGIIPIGQNRHSQNKKYFWIFKNNERLQQALEEWTAKKEEVKKYYCYSFNQLKFIIENDIFPIGQYTHNQTNKYFWVFLLDEQLEEVLTEYSNTSPSKKVS